MPTSLAQQLADLLGAEVVLPPEGYSVDGVVPQAAVRPADRQSIAQLLRWAAARQVSVLPRGGGVLTSLGNRPARVDVVMDLSRYNRVLDYQPADLTATGEAGVTLQRLQGELARGGKFLPLEAPLADQATLGGILAANASGPLRYSYGLPRDWLIGISVVSADGVETKAGGKVVKNVTGYDLNKLYTGSLGTLGVIVEATFKLAPLPEHWAALVAPFSSVPAGIEAGRSLVSEVYAPQGLHVVNGSVARRLNLIANEAELSRMAGAWVLAFFAGRPRAVGRRLEESTRRLRQAGAIGVEVFDSMDEAPAATPALLRRLTDLGWGADTLPTLGLKVHLPPTAVGKMAAFLEVMRQERTAGFGDGSEGNLGLVADPGFGVVQLFRWPEKENPAAVNVGQEPAAATSGILAEIERLREAARSWGGTVVVEQCPPAVKAQIDVWGSPATESEYELEIMRRIKQNFDPAGTLNPGRFMGKL